VDTKKLRQLLLIEGLLAAAAYLAGSFILVFFVARDFSYVSISVFAVLEFGTATISLSLLRNRTIRSPRVWMAAGMVLLAMTYSCYVLLPPSWVLIVAPIFFGAYMPFFWLPFNTLYMDLTKATDRGMITGIYYMIWPLIGILMPVLGGASIEALGYVAVFTSGIILVAANAAVISTSRGIENKPIQNRLIIPKLGKGLSGSFVLQGAQEGIFFATMPLLSFEFAKGELGLGGLLAIFAIAGALASVFIGRYSDIRGKRSLIARLAALSAGPLLVVSALMQDIVSYTMVMGIAYFAIGLVWMMLLAVSIDYAEREKGPAIYTREILLQGGRAVGAVVLLLVILLFDLRIAHAISGFFISLIFLMPIKRRM
jgi:predicted MFS family arabinose efflux permease